MVEKVPGLKVLIPVAVVGAVAAFAVDLLPPWGPVGYGWTRALIRGAGLLLAACPGIISYIRAEQRHRQAAKQQECREAFADLRQTLVASIPALFEGESGQSIRANVMIVSGDVLRMFCSVNMEVSPDARVTLRKGQGCAGVAWKRAVDGPIGDCWKPVYAPRAQLTPRRLKEKWKLTEDQIERTGHILWVLSIPLFAHLGDSRRFLGVLNYDGVQRQLRRPRRLDEEEFLRQSIKIGEKISEVLLKQCEPVLGLG
ncbi:MAG: hypothetical protein ABSG17_09015 [Spirochaetia bacterium]|jgi:hypothetical protein